MTQTFLLRLAAILVLTILPARAAVFSDEPQSLHDPRHPQPQSGADKMFAPIGLVATNHRVPHQAGNRTTINFDMGTGFLVSPCYVLTNYHVVFGNRRSRPDPNQDFSTTFVLGAKKVRAVPVKYGEFYRFEGRDWALLLLDSDAEHRCLGEDPEIGWTELSPLKTGDAMNTTVSTAGYPSDKSVSTLWRQDKCQLFERHGDIDYDGVWTTDCGTRPRSSGSPIFFVQDGVLRVVALMAGHLGIVAENEILPKWDPNRANLALDIGKIVSSDDDFLKLIQADIDRYRQLGAAIGSQPGGDADSSPPNRQSEPAATPLQTEP